MKKILRQIFNHKYHFITVTSIASLLIISIYNQAFWADFFEIIWRNDKIPALFKLNIPLALFLLLNAIFIILFSYKYVLKPILIFLFMATAIANYASVNYGIIFDNSMIENFAQTNVAEAKSYLSLKGALNFLIFGIIPSLIILKIKIYYPKIKISMLQRGALTLGSFIIIGIITFSYYQQLAFIARENRILQKKILPTSYLVSTFKYVQDEYFASPQPYITMGNNLKTVVYTDKPKLFFVVLGETARVKNYSYEGYKRHTNYFTDKFSLVNFKDVSSCGTATAISVPCMFSNLNRKEYDSKLIKNRENLVDVFKKAGYNLVWYDNDEGCKGVCDRIKTIRIKPNDTQYCKNGTCFDGILLKYLSNFNFNTKKDTIVFFHLMGSHGPRYYERYPKSFQHFIPECNRADVENCSLTELVNSYDNSIYYTDYIISQLIEVLKQHAKNKTVALLYISDHGESLGENKIFLHGTPYAFAPKEQTKVPLQVYLPDESAKALQIDKSALIKEAKTQSFSHDNLFHSLLGLSGIQTDEYNCKLDMFRSCHS